MLLDTIDVETLNFENKRRMRLKFFPHFLFVKITLLLSFLYTFSALPYLTTLKKTVHQLDNSGDTTRNPEQMFENWKLGFPIGQSSVQSASYNEHSKFPHLFWRLGNISRSFWFILSLLHFSYEISILRFCSLTLSKVSNF